MHHSTTPSFHYSSLYYVGARRLSATKHMRFFQQPAGRCKFDLLISSVVTVAHEKVYEVTYADH